MDIEVVYEKGAFMPLKKVKGLKEGQKLQIHTSKDDFHKIVVEGRSFDFLDDEEDLYSEEDVIERV